MTEYSFEDRISRSPENIRQRAINKGLVANTLYSNSQKIIRKISLNSKNIDTEYIPSSGKILPIKIYGSSDAMFTVTAKDSSGCSILKQEVENVKIGNKGVYDLTIKIPSINSVKGSKGIIAKQTYTITLTPSADTNFSDYLGFKPFVKVLNQHAKSKITIDDYAGNTTGLTFTATAKSQTGEANQINNYQGYTDISFPIAVKYTSYSAGNIYVKNTDFNSSIIKSNTITGINYRSGETGPSSTYYFSVSVNNGTGVAVKEFVGTNFEERVKDTITVGSKAKWEITHEKFIIASLDENDNIIDFDKCKDKTTRNFKISDTNNIAVGMGVRGDNVKSVVSSISSCKTKIQLQDSLIIKPNTVLTFTNKGSAKVIGSSFNQSKGKTQIIFNSIVDIPEQTVVTFDDDTSIVRGVIKQTGSGNTGNGDANDVDLTCTIAIKKFGEKPELTYFLDMDKIISVKPNAYNQSVVTAKNTTIAIDMIKFDNDTNRTSKTGTVVRPPSHGTVSSYNTTDDAFAYAPNNNFVGSDSFTFTMSDGTNTSDEKTVLIEVLEGASGTSDTLSGGGG